MGGWMGEGGDFQRTGWMVGSEKREIHWVNDPRKFSDFVHNFQHHKKLWIVKEYYRLQSLLSKWNTLFAVCHWWSLTINLLALFSAYWRQMARIGCSHAPLILPQPFSTIAIVSNTPSIQGNRQAGCSNVPGCSHSNFAASILYQCWNSREHSKNSWNYSSIFCDLLYNWILQTSLNGYKVNICQVTPSQSSGLGNRYLGWKFNKDFLKVENQKVVESAGMKEN